MDKQNRNQPIYREFIRQINSGFLMLDENSREEVRSFVRSQQHTSGAFVNRGENPDLYYSLFGAWLSEALELNEVKQKLANYSEDSILVANKLIDRYALLLIRLTLNKKQSFKPNLFFFLKTFFYSSHQLNSAYRAFLFLLSFDAVYGHRKFLYFLLKIGLKRYHVPEGIPCSFRAAWLLAKQIVGLDVKKDIELLFEYYGKGLGFKAFKDVETPDLLSTAVALFVLERTGADLRMVAPDALELVQQNYDSGAFLSGNGDKKRDLEYTFYGLLILGTLSEQ